VRRTPVRRCEDSTAAARMRETNWFWACVFSGSGRCRDAWTQNRPISSGMGKAGEVILFHTQRQLAGGPFRLAGGGVSARRTAVLSGGRSFLIVPHVEDNSDHELGFRWLSRRAFRDRRSQSGARSRSSTCRTYCSADTPRARALAAGAVTSASGRSIVSVMGGSLQFIVPGLISAGAGGLVV